MPSGEGADDGGGVGQRDTEAAAGVRSLLVQRSVVEEAAAVPPAQEEVGSHVEVVAQFGVLADDRESRADERPGAADGTGRPSRRISPTVGVTSPATQPTKVVLPAPFSPARAISWPDGDLEVDAVEGPQGTETNAETLDRKQDPPALGTQPRRLRR